MTTIAFLGLGHMGAPMAERLVGAGHEVLGYDIAEELRERAEERGIPLADSGAEAAAVSDIVLTMFPEGSHVIAAYAGDRERAGLVAAARPDTVFLDCSTIAVAQAKQVAEMAIVAGHRALDAPVSGGVVGAENGTLAFMVGGDASDFEEVRPLLETMGRRIVHCGEHGLGQAAKVCNNMILGVSQIVVAEAFVLGERLGLDPQVLFDVASNASAQCWALSTNCPVPGPVPTSPANHGYAAGFASRLMAKDLGLAEHAIEDTGVSAPFGLLARERYASFAVGERANLDFSAIIAMIREETSPDASTERQPRTSERRT